MKILITGGTGFIGKALCPFLLENKHNLTLLSRQPSKTATTFGSAVHVISNIDQLKPSDCYDAIINLAGEGIATSRWSKKRKQVLLKSRINTTEQLITYIKTAEKKPHVLISGSAIGYYGNQQSRKLTEKSEPFECFSHQLCEKWETAALQADEYQTRVCIIRIGLVLGHNGGFLKRMLPPFKYGLGGTIGNGEQWMSWIHNTDLIYIINKLLESNVLHGVFNATSPEPVTNAEFCATLGKVLNRPVLFPIPAFVLTLLLGEMSELLMGGQRVIPQQLEKAGFEFKFKNLKNALIDSLLD